MSLCLSLVAPTIASLLTFASAHPAPIPSTKAPEVHALEGVLVFRDFAAYESVCERLQSLDRAAADAWERGIGFTSQRNLFDRVVDAEHQLYLAPYEHLPEEELVRFSPPSGHSPEYEYCLARGVIREVGDTYDYALASPSMARVVNEDGFFVVGNVLFQARGPLLKEWPGAALARRHELDALVSDDGARGVHVTDLSREAKGPDESAAFGWPPFFHFGHPWWPFAWIHPVPTGAPPPCGNFDKSTGWITNGSRRGSLRVIFQRTWWNPYPYKKVTTKFDVNVQSQKKNFWGNWVYATCPNEVWISGSWTAEFRMIFATNLAFAYSDYGGGSFSYPHPNCINNFWGSFAPKSGANLPYASTTIYTAPADYAFSEVCIKPMTWSASVPGGCCGISMTITN